MSTNTTNSTHCSAPVPVSDPFLLAVDRASPASFVIASVEDTYKPTFRITTDGIRTLPYQPFFSAYLSKIQTSQTGAGREVTLVADAVLSNIGQHYNTTTGHFTAPISGVYHFDCSIYADKIAYGWLESFISLRIGSHRAQKKEIRSSANLGGLFSRTFETSWTGFMKTNQTAAVRFRIVGMPENSASFMGTLNTDSIFSRFSGYLLG